MSLIRNTVLLKVQFRFKNKLAFKRAFLITNNEQNETTVFHEMGIK